MSPLSAAGRLADEFFLVPRIADPGFVPATLDIARTQGVDMIVPTIDTELAAYAQAKDTFAAHGVDVLISSPDVVTLSSDKWKLYQWLTQRGLPTVVTAEWDTFDPGAFTGPVVAKPRNGSSSVGLYRGDTVADLPVDRMDSRYIIQQRAAGIEITADFAVDRDGSLIDVVLRRRLETRAGEVSKAVTVKCQVVADLVSGFARALPGAYGVLNAQVFYDPVTVSATIIELNARAGGGYPLSHEAGADLFSPFCDGVLPGAAQSGGWEADVVMVRFDDAAFFRSDAYRVDP
jgi:carbamoyl-phosphate synthase large subunit